METIEIICTVIGAVATVLGGMWFMLEHAAKSAVKTYRLSQTEEKLSSLPCKEHETTLATNDRHLEQIDNTLANVKGEIADLKSEMADMKGEMANMKGEMANMKNDIWDMKEDIAAIKAVLVQKFPNAANVFSMKKSPRRLNETGEKLFADIHGEEFLQKNKDFFFSKIDAMKPKTALDVENAANFACSGYTDEDMFNDIKDYVYNAPSITIKDEDGKERLYDITLGDVCYVLSLPLRDMYLKERFKPKDN